MFPALFRTDLFDAFDWSFSNTNAQNFNIARKDNLTTIEISALGLKDDEIDVTQEGSKLYVVLSPKPKSESYVVQNWTYPRETKQTFTLQNESKVKEAKLDCGVLRIVLEQNIPEHKKAKKIPILISDG